MEYYNGILESTSIFTDKVGLARFKRSPIVHSTAVRSKPSFSETTAAETKIVHYCKCESKNGGSTPLNIYFSKKSKKYTPDNKYLYLATFTPIFMHTHTHTPIISAMDISLHLPLRKTR